MVKVVRKEKESIDSLLKRFKYKVENNKVILESINRMYYLKPSEIKKQKKHASKRRQKIKTSSNE